MNDWSLLGGSLLVTLKVTFQPMRRVARRCHRLRLVQSRWIESAFFPYAVLLQVTPIVAIAPLIIIWVQSPTLSLVICATIVAIFPVISNTTPGCAA